MRDIKMCGRCVQEFIATINPLETIWLLPEQLDRYLTETSMTIEPKLCTCDFHYQPYREGEVSHD